MGPVRHREAGGAAALRLEGIHASYKTEALRGIDLRVEAGEIVALVGPNGAGKSSLFKVIAGLLKPDRGRVLYGGHDITGSGAHERARRGISYVMQGGKVFSSLTVAENLELGMPRLPPAERGRRVAEVSEAFPVLRAVAQVRAGLLSGGVRQVVALASKLVRCPRLLLLDEPAVGLSPLLMGDVLGHLRGINRERGTSILIAERSSPEVLGLSDRAVLLRDGRVVLTTDRPAAWLADEGAGELFPESPAPREPERSP